jgi:uncharacterized protein (DUF4213/DUF364 family)
VGFIYSSVQLENQATGVAFSFPNREHCRHGLLESGKPLRGRSVDELISFLGGDDLLASSVALAAVNAVIQSEQLAESVHHGDILDELNIHTGDQVCMVGCFYPLIKKLESQQARVIVFDEAPKQGLHRPEELAAVLKKSQIALITATSIINNTIEQVLDLAKSCREIVVLGPSTPMLASVFRETPVTCLSGIHVADSESVQRIIMEGGGFRDFKRHIEKQNIRISGPVI